MLRNFVQSGNASMTGQLLHTHHLGAKLAAMLESSPDNRVLRSSPALEAIANCLAWVFTRSTSDTERIATEFINADGATRLVSLLGKRNMPNFYVTQALQYLYGNTTNHPTNDVVTTLAYRYQKLELRTDGQEMAKIAKVLCSLGDRDLTKMNLHRGQLLAVIEGNESTQSMGLSKLSLKEDEDHCFRA